MPSRNKNRLLVDAARGAMTRFKYQAAQEVGVPERAGYPGVTVNEQTYEELLDAYKYRVAQEVGLRDDIDRKGWADMPTRDCGAIGGRVGGAIGGHMVARMIRLAQESMAAGLTPPPAPRPESKTRADFRSNASGRP